MIRPRVSCSVSLRILKLSTSPLLPKFGHQTAVYSPIISSFQIHTCKAQPLSTLPTSRIKHLGNTRLFCVIDQSHYFTRSRDHKNSAAPAIPPFRHQYSSTSKHSNMSSQLIPSKPSEVMVIRNVTPNIATFSVPFARFGKVKIGGRGTLGMSNSRLLGLNTY